MFPSSICSAFLRCSSLPTLLPFLNDSDKLAHVTHLCRSFPALTTTCFRHDHIVLPVQCVRQRHSHYLAAL